MEATKQAYLQKLSGTDKRVISGRATVLSVEEICESITTIWPAHTRSEQPGGIIIYEVWDSDGLKSAGVVPAYIFRINKMRRR